MKPGHIAGVETPQVDMLVNGEWVTSLADEFIPVENPARRQVIATVPRGRAADVGRAVEAAAAAFPSWKLVPPRERGQMLLTIADKVVARQEEIALQMAAETGNAIRTLSRGEVKTAIDLFRYFGGLGSELKGETIPLGETMLSYSRREPLGVVGGIIPWNAPVLLAAAKIAPALLAGNTLVLKAAEDAPLAVLMLAEVCAEVLPPGVLNVITGYGEECGAPLASHPLVQKVSFTGSTEVGRAIMHAVADRIVPVSLELGGKNPSIVFPSGDADWSIDGIIAAARFTRQGQSCTSGSRLFLHESIVDSFLDKLVARVKTLRIGDPLDEASDIGALINRKQFGRVCSYIEDGLGQRDGEVVLGGLPPSSGPLSEGYFIEPTIIRGVSNDWRIAREEIFGPVVVVIPWSDPKEVIKMANDSHYGLAAYIWTRDIGEALRTAHALDTGWVQINQGGSMIPGQSYGGYKQSGLGREFSLEGMLESFTQRKSITVNLSI